MQRKMRPYLGDCIVLVFIKLKFYQYCKHIWLKVKPRLGIRYVFTIFDCGIIERNTLFNKIQNNPTNNSHHEKE